MKLLNTNENAIDEFIKEIKLSESLEDIIEKRYSSIGEWLNRQGSSIKEYDPVIYPQGSVRTGTAIKPLGNGAYDVDLVCELKLDYRNISPFKLKKMIGDEIKLYMSGKNFKFDIKESRKCWTIEYADKVSFHVDVLPAIKKIENAQITDIHITNDTIAGPPGSWEDSNPKGFALWLKNQEFQVFSNLEKNLKFTKKLELIPEHKVLTPLRKSIMLLKRHRDVFFESNNDFKTVSVIITTLAGQFYANNPCSTTEETLRSIIKQLKVYSETIKTCNYHLLVSPSSNENFLDKWNIDKKYRIFFESWIEKLVEDIVDIKYFLNSCKDSDTLGDEELKLFLLGQKHRTEKFPLKIDSQIKCNIVRGENLYASQYNGNKIINNKDIVNKKIKIKFIAETNIDRYEKYKVYWRVINTGTDAFRSNCLRGSMFLDRNYPKSFTREEPTGYSGIHSIEAFIVKDEKIIAKSAPFIVKIK